MEFHAKRSSAQGLLPIQCLAILIALFRVRLLAVYVKNHYHLFVVVISYTTSLQILNIRQINITIHYELRTERTTFSYSKTYLCIYLLKNGALYKTPKQKVQAAVLLC